jgi:predicted Zn-dependent peptidase
LEPRVIFLNVPASADCIIFAGNVVPARTSPDYFSLAVFNQVLGGSVNSRLILNLRESKGYAYYVFSLLDAFPGFSLFLIRARVTPEALFASVQEILNEIRTTMGNRLPTADIEQAKTTLIGSFPLSFEHLESFSEKITESKALGLGDDYWSRYYENAKLVNAERVFEVVQALPLQTPLIVIAGDKSIMADQLRFFDKVDIYDAQGTFQYSLKKETDK